MDTWLKILIIVLIPEDVQSNKLVKKTSCLELAKPSNEKFRMSCSQHLTYHCLLDETFTKEFEVCSIWMWIPEGQCAYFNTYGEGNIDGRPCEYSAKLVCPTRQYSSAENTKYTACYMKKITSTTEPRIRISLVTSNGTSNRRNSTYFPKPETTDKEPERTIVALPIVFGFITFAIFIAVISFYFVRFKYFQRQRKECQESRDLEMNEDTSEQQPFFKNETKDTWESLPTMSHQDETKTGARKSGNSDANEPADMNESDNLSEHFEVASSYLSSNKQINSEVSSEDTDEGQSGSGFDSATSDSEEERDRKESTGVFDDTFESLQRKAAQTDAKGHEELYSLLNGGTLTKKVMAAVIKKMTGKTAKELLDDENVQNKLQNLLHDGINHIPHLKEREDSLYVLYALLQIFLDEKYYPKSGWGSPVKDEDIGIGDDIDRLYRIFTITEYISTPNMVSLESYNRLLDIMFKTCTRLGLHVDAQLNEYIKIFISNCRSTILTEKVKNYIYTFVSVIKK